MDRKQARLVAAGAALGVAGVLAYLATRSAGPVQLTQYTELREGPLMEHLVSREELGTIPSAPRHHYPNRVAPGLTAVIANGFAPLYKIPDAVAASLPAEVAW